MQTLFRDPIWTLKTGERGPCPGFCPSKTSKVSFVLGKASKVIWTLKTGEDIALAFAVRHHAKVALLSWDAGGVPGAHFTCVTKTKKNSKNADTKGAACQGSTWAACALGWAALIRRGKRMGQPSHSQIRMSVTGAL